MINSRIVDTVPFKYIPHDYKCEICGHKAGMFSPLVWGAVFRHCYCTKCETPYKFEKVSNNWRPVLKIKEGWLEAVKLYWETYRLSIMNADSEDIEACRWITAEVAMRGID